jgi:hypothetical protein
MDLAENLHAFLGAEQCLNGLQSLLLGPVSGQIESPLAMLRDRRKE